MDTSSQLRLGIVTDSHAGKYDKDIVAALQQHDLDAVIFLGDAPSNMQAEEDEQQIEIMDLLRLYDTLGFPVYWMPGNYEAFNAYRDAFLVLMDTISNIVEVCTYGPVITLKNYDLLFLPGSSIYTRGYHIKTVLPTGIYHTSQGSVSVFNPDDISSLVKNSDKTIVFMHHPCAIEGDNAIDVAIHAHYQGQRIVGPAAHSLVAAGKAPHEFVHQGDSVLSKIFEENNLKKCISGDIHEAIGAVDSKGNLIAQETFSKELFANPGAAKHGHYGILVINGDNAQFTPYSVAEDEHDPALLKKQLLNVEK